MNQTPEQIYQELSLTIIGQEQAKRTLAVAMRNRWRKQQLSKAERMAIRPHHVLMSGPSGSGKSECGKQLAKLSNSPFVKAEATQFTEVGYVGREVSEIVEDLVTEALSMLRSNANKDNGEEDKKLDPDSVADMFSSFGSRDRSAEHARLLNAYQQRYQQAEKQAESKLREAMNKLVDLIEFNTSMEALAEAVAKNKLATFVFPELSDDARKALEDQLMAPNLTPKLHRRQIFVPKVHQKPFSDGFKRELEKFGKGCLGEIVKFNETLPDGDDPMTAAQVDKFRELAIRGQQFMTSQKSVRLSKLRLIWRSNIIQEELTSIPYPGQDHAPGTGTGDPVIDIIAHFSGEAATPDKTKSDKPEKTENLSTKPPTIGNAVKYAEQFGMIFIDEIDKLMGKASERSEATRQGVQRDLLPLLDGCLVKTQKYGTVDTSNMLFICSGAFQLNKPEEMLVELQGRLPIRVQLEALSVEDFVRILKIKQGNILDQYVSMMRTDGIDLTIVDEAIEAIAKAAFNLNLNHGNYGARRLYACVERALEDITFLSAPEERIAITITKEYIENHLGKH